MGAEKFCLRPILLSVKNTHCKLVSLASSIKRKIFRKESFLFDGAFLRPLLYLTSPYFSGF